MSLWILLTLIMHSCRIGQQKLGGPCHYQEVAFAASIDSVRIIQVDSAVVWLNFHNPSMPMHAVNMQETVNYRIDSAFVTAHSLEAGDTLHGDYYKITKGSCVPEYYVYEDL